MTYEVTDRVARITFNRPEKGNAIVADTPLELSALVERADLDPNVHVILVSGRGQGFCAGFDLSAYADRTGSAGGEGSYHGTVLDGKTQGVNHLPNQPWDPMIDYQMMSRFVRGFSSLMHCDKPTVVKIHGYCVAGGTDIALHADQVIAAADAKIGYPPTRVWGVPAAGLWAHRLGDQRAKRLLFTGDCITGAQAAEWGLAVEAPEPEDLDERTERLVATDRRVAGQPADHDQAGAEFRSAATGCRHQSHGQHRVRRGRPAHARGARIRRRRGRARLPRCGQAPRRTVRRLRPANIALRCRTHAESAARMTARSVVLSVLLGAHPAWASASELIRLTADFGIKETTLRVALTRMVSAGDLVRSADGYRLSDRLLARQRRQDEAMRPQTRAWRGSWHVVVVTSVGTDARTRAALRNTMHDKRFGELREGVWMRPDNLDLELEPDVAARVRVLKAHDECPGRVGRTAVGSDRMGRGRRTGYSTKWPAPQTFPHGSWWLRRWCGTCLPTRCCPTNCCPLTGRAPGCARPTTTSPPNWRNDATLNNKHDMSQLQEAT